MSSSSAPYPSKNMAVTAVLYALALCAAFSGAWLISLWLKEQGGPLGQPFFQFAYWLAMRLLLWVLPSLAIIRRTGKSVGDVLGLGRIRAIALWGGIAGLVWGGKTPLFMLLAHKPLHPAALDWSFVTAVLYAPLVEEITFRGAIMGALETRLPFAMANFVTGVLFLLVHIPGWYFEGVFTLGFTYAAGSALAILLLGWLLGYVAHRSKSVAAAAFTHTLNNLFQRFVP